MQRTRDVKDNVRAAVYRVMKDKLDMRALSIDDRVTILTDGLGDRSRKWDTPALFSSPPIECILPLYAYLYRDLPLAFISIPPSIFLSRPSSSISQLFVSVRACTDVSLSAAVVEQSCCCMLLEGWFPQTKVSIVHFLDLLDAEMNQDCCIAVTRVFLKAGTT